MRRLMLLSALCALAMLMATPALAQQDLDCDDFASQADAQAQLRANPSDPNGLDGIDDDGIACESLPAPRDEVPVQDAMADGGGGGTQQDLDCADFATQAEAQATFNADPSDPNRLDADDDGEACEDSGLPSGPTSGDTGGDGGEDGTQPLVTPDQAVVTPDQAVVTPDLGALPDSGGASALLPMAGALLVAGGLLSVGLLRRR